MKNKNTLLGMVILGCLFSLQTFAQVTVNMPYNTGVTGNYSIAPPGTCSFNFYDNGGSGANYTNSANATTSQVTFAPSVATNKIQAQFTSFAIESGWDGLYVFDGTSNASPLISSGLGTPLATGNLGAGAWAGGTAPFNVAANVVRATGATGALHFAFCSDGSVSSPGWSALVTEAPVGACAMTAPANVVTSTSAGVCAANSVTVAAPSFNPGGCNANFSLQYRLNGGAAVVIGSVVPATITLLNIPKGVTTITWELVTACGGSVVSSVTSTVTVNDLTPPSITCPGNVTLNLGPGECRATYSYTVAVTDNCPYLGPLVNLATITTSGNGNSVGGAVQFDIVNNTTTNIRITGFGMNISGATMVNVYTKSGTHVGFQTNAAAWTLTASANATVGPFSGGFPGNGTITPAPITSGSGYFEIPPGTTGVVLHTISASSNYTNGNGANQTFTDGTLTLNLGSTQNALWTGFFNPRVFNGYVQYQTGTLNAPDPTQTSGVASGGEFELGVTTNCFTATDAAGNTNSCCFTVTVNEYPNATNTLSCNDLVQISLDENCVHDINADDILEGGPYKCYDSYTVQLDKTLPLGNGPWVPAHLTSADIGKTYAVRVVDPATGNSCWGQIKVEDKLPPVLVCRDIKVACNATSFPTEPAPALVGPQIQTITGLNDIIENGPGTSPRIYNFDYSYIPVGTPTLDVNLRIKLTGHTWLPDLSIRAVNPQGTSVNTFSVTGCFGAEFPIDCIFDDEGSGGLTQCVDLDAAGARLQCLQAPGVQSPTVLSALDGLNAGGIWQVRVEDAFAGDDGVIEEVGLEVTVNLPQVLPYDGCSGILTLGNGLAYTDVEEAGGCAQGYSKVIHRKWTATDGSGNTSTCIQNIVFELPTLADLQLPPDYDNIDAPAFECGGVYPTPQWIEGQGLQGFPWVYGEPDGCTISWTYHDVNIDICDGTYKILRKWDVVDWCAGEAIEHSQIIKVLDSTGPSLACPGDMTVSTDPFQCCATANLPDFIASDACSRINNASWMVIGIDPYTNDTIGMFTGNGQLTSFPGNNFWNPDTLVQMGYTPCLPVGRHRVIYTVEDDCGNTSTCIFTLEVKDLTPPVAACDEFTTVAIGIDDPFDCYGPAGPFDSPAALGACEGAGVTWVKASTFDDGSYDNCGNVRFTVRRMAPYSNCILGLNAYNGQPACDDLFPDYPSEFQLATGELQNFSNPLFYGLDSLKFYCCEVGTQQTVILRVYQVDLNGDPIFNSLINDYIYNECMIQIDVQDKIKPVCQSPANVTVSCENFDPSLWSYGKAIPADNCCLDTSKVYQGQCGLTHSASYSQFDTLCNKGTITRTFRAFDCHGLSSQCTQRIVVTYNQDYFVRFPNDAIVTACNGSGVYGTPTFFGKDCEILGVSYTDEVYTVVPDACYKIERTWHIINWCHYNSNLPLTVVPNPDPNATSNSPQNLPGPVVSSIPSTSSDPWKSTKVSVTPGAPQTDYSVYYFGNGTDIPSIANSNGFSYKQIIKIIDTEDPVFADCPASPLTFNDLTANDPLFYNNGNYWDNTIGSHDLCEAPVDLNITVTDSCGGAEVDVNYILFLDMDNDGTMETVINSNQVQPYNSIPYLGGTPFDNRPVNQNQKYRFNIDYAQNGDSRTYKVVWDWFSSQVNLNNTTFENNGNNGIQLPYGTHKIKWVAQDGCGNEAVCEYTFVVKDGKKPTVVCLNGLSVNIMPTGMITLWASDFLQYAEDNCTPANLLKIGIVKKSASTGSFPVDNQGNPLTSVTFTCNELGPQTIQLWAIDLAGNADYCEADVDVQDNMGACGTNAAVAGALTTEVGNGLEEASVELTGSNVNLVGMTDNNGDFMFPNAVPMNTSYNVTPLKDDNHLNGVTTYDLVLISKHILGLDPLSTPYKMIAADANKSGSITTFDIVELRKLILGIYNELPNNTSWRFVDSDFTFADPTNPFATQFPEFISTNNVSANHMADDFYAVKVGDVNYSAITSSLVNSDDRTAGSLLFDVADRAVKAGETFTVNFKAAEQVAGYQFTMNLNNLEVVSVQPGAGMNDDNFGIFADAITTSFNGKEAGEFAVTFRAKADGNISNMVGVSSRITKAEAYKGDSRLDVAFRFNGSTIAGVGFELYQNSPNPFVNKTMIGFHLPEATEATLSIYDETGRMIFTQTGDFTKGYNAVSIDRKVLNTTGMLYYKLETATDSATRKMIQTK